MRSRFGACIAAAACLGPLCLAAQGGGGSASITGRVADVATDSGIESAIISAQGTLLRARSGTSGHYRLTGLAPGSYTLEVLALGYQPDTVVVANLTAGETRDVTLRLERAPIGMTDVVVTAERAPESSQRATASVTVLPREEVIRRNVNTLDKALLYQPGVTFNGSDQIDIRGSSGIAKGVGSRVLLMLDGHPILSGDGAETDFSSVPLLDFDRVEVVKGAYSAVYGSNALGGVANIITTPVGSRPETVGRLYYGVYQTQSQYKYTNEVQSFQGIGLQHSQRIGDVGARLYFGRETSDGFHENGVDDRWVARAKLTSSEAGEHPWDLYAIWAQEKVGESLTWKQDSVNQPAFTYPTYPYEVPDSSVGDYEIDYKTLIGGSWTPVSQRSTLLRVSPYVNYNSTYNHFQVDRSSHTATRAGINMQYSVQPQGTRPITLGVDVAHTWVHSTDSLLGNPEIGDGAVFGQYDMIFHGIVKASAGLRVDGHQATGSSTEIVPSPKLGVVVSPSTRFTVRASVGHGYRAPSAIEQFVNTFQYGFHVVRNPDLKGEKAWSGEVGMTSRPWQWIRLDAAAFGSTFRDQIGPQLIKLTPPTAQFKNVSEAYVRGVDVGLRTSFLHDFVDAQATYLFLDSQDKTTGLPLPYRSKHNLTTTVNAAHGLVGVDVRYRSRVEEVLLYAYDPRSAFTVVDLRLNYRVLGTYVQAKVENVFNTFYTDVQERLAGAPRSVGVTLYSTF